MSVSNNGKYRGGFRTSICDLFKDPSRRTDCCALAFLGIFSDDRTNHLLSKHYNNGLNVEPPSWRLKLLQRFFYFVFFPATVAILFNLLEVDTSIKTYMFWLYVVFLSVLKSFAVRKRRINRLRLLKVVHERNLMEEMSDGTEIDNDEVQRFVYNHRGDVNRAHGLTVVSAFSKDIEMNTAAFNMSSHVDNAEPNGDFCTSIWNFLKCICCGACCTCWLQCCGICAIAQEEREINLLLPKSARMIDYISFQPFEEYYPSIQSLRRNANGSFIDHLHSISELSKVILQSLLSFLVLALLFSLTGINKNFTIAHFFVLLGVFGQAFVVIYLVHWRWHRFSLSLDAVIKYFASGFFISVSFALVYEFLLQIFTFIIGLMIIQVEVQKDSEFSQKMTSKYTSTTEKQQLLFHFIKDHKSIVLFLVFIYAFVVAALVEEMSKYFGFWMVDHPDFVVDEDFEEEESRKEENISDDNLHIHEENSKQINYSDRSLNQIGTSTTIGLVAAATGFACMENIIYVFSYSPAGLESEIIILLIRAILPVHPICAAIQSIGICKRDLEKDQSIGLGKALFPAILLHGTYDFVLMASAAMTTIDSLGKEKDDVKDDTITWSDLMSMLPSFSVPFGVVSVFVVYYIIASKKQKMRLESLQVQGSYNNIV